MTATESDMAEEQKQKKGFTFQLRCERDWLEVVTQEAHRLGMSAAAYIRQAVNERLESTGALTRKRKKKD